MVCGAEVPLVSLVEGCDILTFSFGMLALGTASRMSAMETLLAILIGCILPSYSYDWEMRYTHVLSLGSINGPCEGNVFAYSVFLIVGIWGTEFDFQSALGVQWMPVVRIGSVVFWVMILSGVATIFPQYAPSPHPHPGQFFFSPVFKILSLSALSFFVRFLCPKLGC